MDNIVDRSTAKYSVGAQLDFLVLSLLDIFDLSLDEIKPWRFGISVSVNASNERQFEMVAADRIEVGVWSH